MVHNINHRGDEMVCFMYDELLRIAYDKSDEIIADLKIDDTKGMIDSEKVINAVAARVGCKIEVSLLPFSTLQGKVHEDIFPQVENCGAMMLTTIDGSEKVADIVLNEDKGPEFQRFSLIHELGHLSTADNIATLFHADNDYVVSTHIDYKVTSIKRDMYEHNDFLRKEQLANIFALRVLMPRKAFYDAVKRFDSITEVAKCFGLSKAAAVSRIMLVE